MLTSKAMDLESLLEKIKGGKLTSIEQVLSFIVDMDNVYTKIGIEKAKEWIEIVRNSSLSQVMKARVGNEISPRT